MIILALLLLDVHSYDTVNPTQTCSSNGLSSITTAADCEAAAQALNINFNSCCQYISNEPYGCQHRLPDNDILFNGNPNSPTLFSNKNNRAEVCSTPTSGIPTPPAGSGTDCYMYIDQDNLADCDDWQKPVNQWWNGGHSSDADDPCDAGRIGWWGYGFWQRCLRGKGFPYPGYGVTRINDHAVVYTTMGEDRLNINTPPQPENEYTPCYMYYDEASLGYCDNWNSDYRPPSVWMNISHSGQSCEDRMGWNAYGIYHHCRKDSPFNYPGIIWQKMGDAGWAAVSPGDSWLNPLTPPTPAEDECFFFYDTNALGACDAWTNRKKDVWFPMTLSEGKPTCEDWHNWYAYGLWIKCFKESGYPYPGVIAVEQGTRAYSWAPPGEHLFDVNQVPAVTEADECWIYYDTSSIGECTSNALPNVWYDGRRGEQTCEQSLSWYAYGVWHHCKKDSGFPYPGFEYRLVGTQAWVFEAMSDTRFDISTPPAAPAGECFIYYDEDNVGACPARFGTGKTKVWFDAAYGTQTCEQRVSWYSNQHWHGGCAPAGTPYPGNKVVKVNDNAYIITLMDDVFDKTNPPTNPGGACYIYYDEDSNGACQLFSGGRPGNAWFDGSHGTQTCAERVAWWAGQTWHQCMSSSGNPYPGVDVTEVRGDAHMISVMTDFCPNDPLKTDPGQCDCGVADTDSDGDGNADCNDQCLDDPAKTAPGLCGCGVPDTDSDSDGVPDCNDECPSDPAKTLPGLCGCGVPDHDADGNGVIDCKDLNAFMVVNHQLNHQKSTVSYGKTFEDPIVMTGILGYEGRHHAHIRMDEVTATDCTFFIDESHACKAGHKTENIDLLVFESGGVIKSTQGTLMTGKADVMAEHKHDFKMVTFPEPFETDEIVVIVTIQTHNGGHYVFPRVKGVNADGFQVHLDETFATDGWHMTETIGYLAATKGEYTIAGSTYVVDITSFGGLQMEEVYLPNPMSNLMIFGQIQSYVGAHPVNLRHGTKEADYFTMKMDEDQCGSGDNFHFVEEIGFIAVEPATVASETSLAESHGILASYFAADLSTGEQQPMIIYGLALIGLASIVYGATKNSRKTYTEIADEEV